MPRVLLDSETDDGAVDRRRQSDDLVALRADTGGRQTHRHRNADPTLGFLIHAFWAVRKSSIFGVWTAPAAHKNIPESGGLRPPTCWHGFWGRRGRPEPKNQRFPGGPKTMY